MRPRFGTLKTSKRSEAGAQRMEVFQKAEKFFCPSALPRFAFFTVSLSRCGPAATDFKYEVNIKARQLLLYKAEAKQ
jgi:hypothetical protein